MKKSAEGGMASMAARLAKRCFCWLNSAVLWLKKSRRVVVPRGTVKVNFGSSLSVTNGWINVDGSPHLLFARWPRPALGLLYNLSDARNWCGNKDVYVEQIKNHRFVHRNLEYGLPFPNESVDYLYSSHVLEHFYVDIAEHVLRDAYRVLKKGGRIRICVPDLQYVFALYAQGHRREVLEYLFQSRTRPAFSRHRYMYDFELLAALLEKVGFASIHKCAYQQGLLPDLDRLDNRPSETLYVEAVRL